MNNDQWTKKDEQWTMNNDNLININQWTLTNGTVNNEHRVISNKQLTM